MFMPAVQVQHELYSFIMSDTQVFILLHFLPILKPPNVFDEG